MMNFISLTVIVGVASVIRYIPGPGLSVSVTLPPLVCAFKRKAGLFAMAAERPDSSV